MRRHDKPHPARHRSAKPIHPNLFMLCPNPVTRTLKVRIRLIPSTPTFDQDAGSVDATIPEISYLKDKVHRYSGRTCRQFNQNPRIMGGRRHRPLQKKIKKQGGFFV
jgi:hypothetical protein